VTKTARYRIYLSGTVAVPTSMKAPNRHVERVFNPDRKETHWGETEAQERSVTGRSFCLRFQN
jgi:hypothetical protein